MFIITTGRFSTYYKIKMLIKAIICSFYTLIYYLLSLMVLWGDWAQLGTLLQVFHAITVRKQLGLKSSEGSTGLDFQDG